MSTLAQRLRDAKAGGHVLSVNEKRALNALLDEAANALENVATWRRDLERERRKAVDEAAINSWDIMVTCAHCGRYHSIYVAC